VRQMKVWPFTAALRGEAVKPPYAALAEDCRGERYGKGIVEVSGGDQQGERKRTAVDVSLLIGGIETGCYFLARDEPGGCPSIGQAVPGMEAARAWSAAVAWNVGRHTPIPPSGKTATGRTPSG